MENLISLFVNSVFVGNILLAYFLGMCSYLSVSKNLQTSLGLGRGGDLRSGHYHTGQLAGVSLPAGPRRPGMGRTAPDMDLSFLKLVLFIAVIAGIVQVVEMVIDRYSQSLYRTLWVSSCR